MSKTPEFEKLQKEWYRKLKESGFEDTESPSGLSKRWYPSALDPTRNVAGQSGHTRFDAITQYYRLAGQFSHDFTFKNEFQRGVWELHADGHSVRDIISAMKERGFKSYHWLVQTTIEKLSKEMLSQCQNQE